ALKRWNLPVAFGVAGWVGTVTNTILVLSVAVLLKYIPMEAIPAIMPQAIAEQVLAIIITVAVGMAGVRVLRTRHS
ncbi:MAG TPA: ECF transporter S component, partial [Actinomycetota bacterium]|nr:ECF transporter S component [Actinomycetota bacterium]